MPSREANKLIFASDGSAISNQQARSNQMILGDRNLLELSGEDHKRVRNALSSFLKPESLKQYVGKMDAEVRKHLEMHWQGKQNVTKPHLYVWLIGVAPDETLTFNILCCLIFGIRARNPTIETRGQIPGICIRGETNEAVISDKRDHTQCFAYYDCTSLVRVLANDLDVYAAVLQEHEKIATGKLPGEFQTWEEVAKMKYRWIVALETLRTVTPIFAVFRTALKDIEFGGYLIPKIFWATSMTHMDNTIFPEPTKFDPTRFENQASIPPYCFIPFGGAPQICPGIEFARIETLVAIHHLVTRFKWKLHHTNNFFSRNPTPEPTEGLPVKIIPRA
ncbi:hypothetical protein AAG906_011901 [Vitis piasezkii]